MEQLRQIISEIEEKVSPIYSEEMRAMLHSEAEQLNKTIDENKLIKVPIVGEFNAGKTSLVNAILQNDGHLPVDAQPETAIPCEIHPVQNNEGTHIVVVREEVEIFNGSIESYQNVLVSPGDFAILYTTSEIVRQWYDKGIVLVDMPGASSGIKEHNDAITRYISQGTVFAFLIDSKRGALSQSGLDFVNEINQYGLNIAFFVTRTDLITTQRLDEVVNYISTQLDAYSIGTICANNQNLSDFINFVDSIKTNTVCRKKLSPIVRTFADNQVALLEEIKNSLTIASNTELDTRINEIKEQINQINDALSNSLQSVDTVEQSTNDILSNVSMAIHDNASHIVDVFMDTPNGSRLTAVNDALLKVIRPTLLKAFKKEQDEFIQTLDTQINQLTSHLLQTTQMPNSILNKLITQNQIAIIQGIKLIAERLMGNGNPIAHILGRLLDFFASYIPGIMQQIFNNQDKMRKQLERQVKGPICNMIINELNLPIQQQVRAMQLQIIEETRKQYEQRINQLIALQEQLQDQQKIENNQTQIEKERCSTIINEIKAYQI